MKPSRCRIVDYTLTADDAERVLTPTKATSFRCSS